MKYPGWRLAAQECGRAAEKQYSRLNGAVQLVLRPDLILGLSGTALAVCRFSEPTALAAGFVVITLPFEARG